MVTAANVDAVIAPSEWQAGRAPVSGGHLAFHRTGGSGPTLVLSHGLTDNGLCWSRIARALAGEFDIVMLDARGHGESARIGAGEAHDPGQDIAEAIDWLGLESPIVMGHSVGARATAAFASAHPGRASKVILEDPPLLPIADRAEVLARREKFRRHVAHLQSLSDAEIVAIGRQSHPDWHEVEFPAWVLGKRQVDPDAMSEAATPWQDTLAAITEPTLLIRGDMARGSLVSAAAAEAMRINPRIRAVQIEGAGHNIRREQFDAFLAHVRAFISEGPGQPGASAPSTRVMEAG